LVSNLEPNVSYFGSLLDTFVQIWDTILKEYLTVFFHILEHIFL